MNNHSSAHSVISSHTRYSAKSQITNITNQNSASGQSAYGSKTKQQIAQEVEQAEDDIMKRYMEQQEKHKQLMIQNQKRRKDQEKKLKEELERKKKQEEEELLKRKETKQQAYVKFLRSNATKVADNLKQNKNNVNDNGNNQVKKKSSTANQQKRPAYIVTTQPEQNKTVTSELSKPKKQWNTSKSNGQNVVNQDKISSQKENRVPVPLEEYYADSKKQSQNNIGNNNKEMNLDALDLNIPTGKDDFDRIKKMYAKQSQVNGNDFIVNFEKEWNDDDSVENLKQSKLLESLDLSTVYKKKNKQPTEQQQNQQKNLKNIKSDFDNIQENDSFEENEYDQEKFDESPQNRNEILKENTQVKQDKQSRAQLQQQLKQGNKQQISEQQMIKKPVEKETTKPKQTIIKNESALVREAIGFDDDGMQNESEDDDIGTALGFKNKQNINKQEQKASKQTKSEQMIDAGLTEAKLKLHNEIIEGTINLENQKYDLLSWANNKQKEVDEVFSQVSGKVSNATSKITKPVSAKIVKDDKKPPIARSNTNNNLQQQNQPPRKQNEQDTNSIISEDKMQRQNIRQISANRNAQMSKEKSSQQDRQPSQDKQGITDLNNQRSSNDKSKERKQQVIQPPPTKQKYQKIHQNKVVQSNNQDTNSEVASSNQGNQGRVSKFKQKLQWNVQQSRKSKAKSPDSVGSRDEDLNVEEFLRDDLININKEEMQLQQEIYELHFDNIEKIREVESKNHVNLNLVSSKQVKELENNPSTIIKPIKPIYEYSEQELEQSLVRLDIALAKKTNQTQQLVMNQMNPQIQNGYQQNYNDMRNQQQIIQPQQIQQNYQQNNTQQQIDSKQNGLNIQNQVNFQNPQANLNNNINNLQQQIEPNNLIAFQLQVLQQQQQLLLQKIVNQQQNQNNLELNPPPVLQNQVNSMKVQQILNTNQLTYKNLAEQNESLNKIEQNFSQGSAKLEKLDKKDKGDVIDQNMYISPQFGMNNNNSKRESLLNNHIKNVTSNVSLTSQHQQQQSQYNYDINDLQSISQVNSVVPSNNVEQRRQKLKDELDEEVESKISEMKSKIQSKDKEQTNSYKQKHIVKKEIKHKKIVGQKEEKPSQLKEQQDNAEGVIKYAGNDKLKALLLDNVEEEDYHNYNNQENSFD